MKYHEMTKNYCFREFECGLSIEETAKLCFKSVKAVKDWDSGKPIPKECKRLMRMYKRLDLSHLEEWRGFNMSGKSLVLPTGQAITPQELLCGIGLLEIQSELEIRTTTKLLKFARTIARLMIMQ